MKESDSLNLARSILEKKDFRGIKFLGRPYDFEAEKDGIQYGIEVKGSSISFTIDWLQIKQLHFQHFLPKGHKALLMFVTEESCYCIFEMVDAQTVRVSSTEK
jgi:hypothetical protein